MGKNVSETDMKLYFAPMEGVTTMHFRRVHAAMFPGADRYYAPFISPTSDHRFTPREVREIGRENNTGIDLVPQILTKSAEDFLWCASGLADMGYGEVNLNLGCPSATVTAKGKGAGLLRTPEALERLLDGIFAKAEIPVSIKTRIGYAAPEEWEALLALYSRYPIAELIVHCRTREELYGGEPHRGAFSRAREALSVPLCYNGNLFTVEDVRDFEKVEPGAQGVMLGRGAAEDPALFRRLRGGAPCTREELRAFHDTLYEMYTAEYGRLNAMRRMKELWSCLLYRFEDAGEIRRKMMRTKDTGVFDECVAAALDRLALTDA